MSFSRWIVAIAGTLLILLLAAGAAGYWYVTAAYPDYERTVTDASLSDPVQVLRDDRAVAHLRATSTDDLYFAQGFVHAQERLWQMDFQRRVVQGRLAEVFGEEQLAADRFLRTLGLSRIAGRILEVTSPEGQRVLERYADGVNAFLAQTDRLPFSFRVLGITPEPWTPEHSVGMVALMAYNLGSNWQEQVGRTALREVVSDTLFQELLPPYNRDTPPVWRADQAEAAPVPRETAALPALELPSAAALQQLANAAHLGGLADHLPQLGSNSWVVAPERSASGEALLANDPHLQVGAPILWYENRLYVPDTLHVNGWSIPGAPAVILGHNDAIAWGMTNTGNTQDLYLEDFDPADTLRVRGPDGYYTVDVQEELIAVDGRAAPDTLRIRLTRNGPVFQEDEEPPLSIRWTAYDVERSPLDAILQSNRAHDPASFRAAFRHFTVPVQNLVYADTSGNIGFFTAGDVPIRPQGEGLVPVPGWDDAYRWTGRIPHDDLPALLNPPQGYIATANHRVTDDAYPYTIERDNAPPYRMLRIIEQLAARSDFVLDDFEAMQTDWYNRHAAERAPQLVAALTARAKDLTDRERAALALVEEWAKDPVNAPEAAGAAIFQVWYLELMRAVFEAEMGPDVYASFLDGRGYLAYNALEHLLETHRGGEASAWLPDGLAPPARASFQATVAQLTEQQGRTPADWRWDRLQRITFDHVLGASRLLRPLVNRGPYPYGGDHMTVGRAAYALTDPFNVRAIAGTRFMMRMGQPIEARAVIAGGQSGHPRHPHSADQLPAWREGAFYTLHPSFAEAADGPVRLMRLSPEE